MSGRFPAAIAAAAIALTGTPVHADATDDAVRAEFLATAGDMCPEAGTGEDAVYPVTFLYPGEPADARPREARIYEFFCYSGPYTVFTAYYVYVPVDGITPVAFAVPDFRVTCIPPAAEPACEAARVDMTGGTTVTLLANAEFDPQALVLTSRLCWRGPCDAFETGAWQFTGGRFVLRQYEVDAAFDGEQAPQRLIDFPLP